MNKSQGMRILLATAILESITHSNESVDEIAARVIKRMSAAGVAIDPVATAELGKAIRDTAMSDLMGGEQRRFMTLDEFMGSFCSCVVCTADRADGQMGFVNPFVPMGFPHQLAEDPFPERRRMNTGIGGSGWNTPYVMTRLFERHGRQLSLTRANYDDGPGVTISWIPDDRKGTIDMRMQFPNVGERDAFFNAFTAEQCDGLVAQATEKLGRR